MASIRDSQRFRLNLVGVVALSLFVALFARLYYLQVLEEAEFQAIATANIERSIPIQAPRGRIIDTKGRVLVDNKTTLVVTVDNFVLNDRLGDPEDRRALALRLATALSEAGRLTKVDSIMAAFDDPKYGPFDQIPIAEGVTKEFKVWLGERSFEYPGVRIVQETVRAYPYGMAAAHVLGYVGPINEAELDLRQNDLKPYQPSDEIGKSGVELSFEDLLRGVPGSTDIIVDAKGNIVEVVGTTSPRPGSDIQLTIDIDLQLLVEAELLEGLETARLEIDSNGTGDFFEAPAGAAVILDPQGAQVLALASYPTYDPRTFTEGITADQFDALTTPDAEAPLNNRVIQGLYAPGSTFKPFTAYAAMNAGLISDRGLLTVNSTINDQGYFEIPGCSGGQCEFQNANRTAYGPVDLRRAITVSSDVYFYRLAWFFESFSGVRAQALQEGVKDFGFGTRTNVALAYEADGLVPDADLKAARHAEFPDVFPNGDWFAGDTLNTSIGQGDMGVTPMQLANAYAALANGGRLYAPNIASAALNPATREVEIDYQPRLLNQIYLPDEIRQPLVDGLSEVPTDDLGTAKKAFEGYPFSQLSVAGKTGTSEKVGKSDFALFTAFAPVVDPDYVVVLVLEEAGFGGELAAPRVRDILQAIATNTVPPAVPVDPDYLLEPTVLPVGPDGIAGDEAALGEDLAG